MSVERSVLVLNAGSSSLKFALFDAGSSLTANVRGEIESLDAIPHMRACDRSGASLAERRWSPGEARDFGAVLRALLKFIDDQLRGAKLIAVGHRVVHGGGDYVAPAIVTKDVLAKLTALIPLDPLHLPNNLAPIPAIAAERPALAQVACFDTAFHHTMPDYAYTYGLPYELCQKLGLRRYGFHGTSHQYVAARTAQLLDQPIEALKIITCHLGNGSSITAVKNGKSKDTSMGLTPLEGVIMGTRCGNVDPGVLTTVMEQEGLDAQGLSNLLNKKSGLLGISGLSSDCREIEDGMGKNKRARLAFEVLCYGVLKYVGGYAAAMNGVDAITFTAGIGENSPAVRSWVCNRLAFLGVKLDEEINNKRSKEDRVISTPDSTVKVVVIPTNEELMIARETLRLTSK